MPNWCSNAGTITPADPEECEKLVELIQEGKLLSYFMPEPDYRETPVAETFPQIKAKFAKTNKERELLLENKPTIRRDSWWDWRVQNWGTKWDVADGSADTDGKTVTFSFNSAWSPPSGAFRHYMENNPGASYVLKYYEPGCDFVGMDIDGEENVYDLGNITDEQLESDPEFKELEEAFNILEYRDWVRQTEEEESEDASE